ncbi:hypothetical protein CKAH01_11796 [Colletotrichum kahawae]|uniref:Uncharacterized protein n=1 Tax=Colletotrichum kahawae TaxID=34407 RepID=A0AAD9YUC2_COLKA|nr:hypothetical protein CKAH01_11796 [Colletotrichum kahawae]
MSTPSRSLPGRDEPERSSSSDGSAAAPHSASLSGSSPPGETQDSLEAKRRAKQAETNARQAEADWLANAIRLMEDGDDDAIEFLQSVLLGDDDQRD